MVSHMPAGKGRAPEACGTTLTIGGTRVEVGTCHDGLCDSLSTNGTEARCSMGDSGPTH